MRPCPICRNTITKKLYEQRFANNFSHNLVSCNKCGFVFVNNIPNQKYYNDYYKRMSKYELERDHVLHKEYVKFIEIFLQKDHSVLDIGCSTGHLLFLLKKRGFTNIFGIDPSPICKKIAKDKFGINIETAEFFSYTPKKTFNFIILAMVLEHIEKVSEVITKMNSLLSDNGYIFVSIPDAANFYLDFDEPFGEFSTEHINFFNSNYLFKLMGGGYTCYFLETDKKNIFSIFRKTESLSKIIRQYIMISEDKLRRIKYVIDRLPSRVMVWGAGSLTQRLLSTTDLKKKVIRLIDSDSKLFDKKLNGLEIISPEDARKYKEPILISSFRFKDEISEYIKKKKLPNTIVTF